MKRFLNVIVLAVFFAAGLFAESKLTEKQVDNFLSKGSYIKKVFYKNGELQYLDYYLKENIFNILVSDENIKIFNENEVVVTIDFSEYNDITLDDNNNIIAVYKS